jgi:hypothetical protein
MIMMIFYITILDGTVPVEILATCAICSLYSPAAGREIITLFRSLSVSNSDCSIMLVCRNHGCMHQLTR